MKLKGYNACQCGNPVDGDHVKVRREGLAGQEFDRISCQNCLCEVVQDAAAKLPAKALWNLMHPTAKPQRRRAAR